MVIGWASVIVLTATLAAILWYSIEMVRLRQATANLHREAVEQRKQQIRPFLTAGWLRGTDDLAIRNVGLASAREVTVPVGAPGQEGVHSLRFYNLTALRADDETALPWALCGPGQDRFPVITNGERFARSELGQRGVPEEFELRVFYRSVARVPYMVSFKVTCGAVYFVSEREITEEEWQAGVQPARS
jgi:hypothetical protein